MRVFIAGATGVLGRALVPLLLSEGYAVRALVRTTGKMKSLSAEGIEIEEGDLLSEDTRQRLSALMEGCEAALHIATAIPADPAAPGAWETNTRLRIEGTRAMLDASLAAGVKQYIQQSIVMAYISGGDRWLDEDTPLDTSPARAGVCVPVIAMEGMVRAIPAEQMAWCILRGGSFVGPGTAQEKLIARLRAGQEVVPCDSRNFISPINVADMAGAIAAALRKAPAGRVFNIVDAPLREGEYLDRLAELVGAHYPPRDEGRPCPPSFRCSNRAAKEVLGWEPTHGIWPPPAGWS